MSKVKITDKEDLGNGITKITMIESKECQLTRSRYITSDGEEFHSQSAAESHVNSLKHQEFRNSLALTSINGTVDSGGYVELNNLYLIKNVVELNKALFLVYGNLPEGVKFEVNDSTKVISLAELIDQLPAWVIFHELDLDNDGYRVDDVIPITLLSKEYMEDLITML